MTQLQTNPLQSALQDLLSRGNKHSGGKYLAFEALDVMQSTFQQRVLSFAAQAHAASKGQVGRLAFTVSPQGGRYAMQVCPMAPGEEETAYRSRLNMLVASSSASGLVPMFAALVADASRKANEASDYTGDVLFAQVEQPYVDGVHEGVMWQHPLADLDMGPVCFGHALWVVERWFAPVVTLADGTKTLGPWQRDLPAPQSAGVIYPAGKFAPLVL